MGKVLNDSDLVGNDLGFEETNPLLIKSIEAKEVFDSRGKSTIKVRIKLNNDLVGT
ncbi:MAG: hypothetical protein PHP14_03850 [Candidatus Pacebacteria bacterium]|nr:hypothetical protein [Candidatus Paceibacterota bacterium]